MPNFSKGHNSGKISWFFFFFEFNQVISWLSPISWPSFKLLSQIAFLDILLTSLKCSNFQRVITPEKCGKSFLKFNRVIYSSSYELTKFQAPSSSTLRYLADKISFWFFQRGITPEREITRSRIKTRVSYFSMRNPIYEISKPWHARLIRYGMHVSNGQTHTHTDAPTTGTL